MLSPEHLAEPHARGIFAGGVLSNRLICPDHYRLRLRLKTFPPTRPGQFVNIRCCTTESVGWAGGPALSLADIKVGLTAQPTNLSQAETIGCVPLLRRPFSLAGRADKPDGSAELDIIYRTVGAGSAWLAGLEAGSQIDILGPLGSGFAIRDDKPQAAIVGGGTGIGPLLYLAEALGRAGRKVTAFAGARTAEAVPLEQKGSPFAFLATDDGSTGFAGMVHQAFRNWLERERPNPADLVVYACGPEGMMKAVAEICATNRIECQLALERHMACGMGVCQGCAVKVKTNEPPGWRFKLVCKDGPVFDAGELIWE